MLGRPWPIALAGGLGLLLAACSAAKPVREAPPTGGFLPETHLLQPGDVGEPAFFSAHPGVVWYGYTKMILEPATLWSGPYGGLASVPPGSRKALANALYTEMRLVGEQLCEMVEKPATGTLLVAVALVDAATSDPTLTTVSATGPSMRLPDTLGPEPFDSAAGTFVARAVLKTIARDATTGAVLWQTIDRRPDQASGNAPLASWRDVDHAFKSWAAKFGNWMSLIGACS